MKASTLIPLILMLAAFMALHFGSLTTSAVTGTAVAPASDTGIPLPDPHTVRRIVSFSPSVTEALFELGLGDRVVGVTRFCVYPESVKRLPKIGGFVDPNYEAVVALKPDLVVLRVENADTKARLDQLGIPSLGIDHRCIEGILDSMQKIGTACGIADSAEKETNKLTNIIDNIRNKNRFAHPPRVLICVGRFMGSGSVKDVYAAGKDHLYDEALAICGGLNACADFSVPYPRLDAETILRLDPDLIIDLAAGQGTPENVAAIAKDWQTVPGLRAVAQKQLEVMTADYVTVPGPRFILFIRDLADILERHARTDMEAVRSSQISSPILQDKSISDGGSLPLPGTPASTASMETSHVRP